MSTDTFTTELLALAQALHAQYLKDTTSAPAIKAPSAASPVIHEYSGYDADTDEDYGDGMTVTVRLVDAVREAEPTWLREYDRETVWDQDGTATITSNQPSINGRIRLSAPLGNDTELWTFNPRKTAGLFQCFRLTDRKADGHGGYTFAASRLMSPSERSAQPDGGGESEPVDLGHLPATPKDPDARSWEARVRALSQGDEAA